MTIKKRYFMIISLLSLTFISAYSAEEPKEVTNFTKEANEKVLFITGIYNNGQVAYYAVNVE